MKQILIVEDDSFLNKMLAYNLTADGYGVTSALNARTAAEAIRQREFNLVLLDINLPDGNGFELCKLIKPQHPDTIVIFLTANDQESDQIRGYEVGAVDLDHMIAGNEAPQRPEDSETQLARIGHRLARLYQIMQENRRRVDEERQELQTLVSDISHQVKTPVSNLKMATDTLLEKPMAEAERTDFIRGIRSQTDKLDFLFQALVKTSRLETGVIQLDKKPGRLFDTVAQAMSGIVYAAEKKEIAVSVDCPEDLTVSHDSKWTSEALFNLLDNAVKYTPASGKIAVSVVLWEMYVEIKVTDTGKGISESNQAAIFQRFYREEEVHEQQGVGIGLYLAREIVMRQGGYIKVVSEPGKGSEFSIMLPLR